VGPARLERATSCSGGKRSIQLSYGPEREEKTRCLGGFPQRYQAFPFQQSQSHLVAEPYPTPWGLVVPWVLVAVDYGISLPATDEPQVHRKRGGTVARLSTISLTTMERVSAEIRLG
jgi:hypothetical protein